MIPGILISQNGLAKYAPYCFLFAHGLFGRGKELQYVELFAGVANVWRCVSCSYPAARVDIEYCKGTTKQNPMDILTSAGWANLS